MLLAFFLTAPNSSRTASGSSLFCKVFSDKEICKEFLETMLHIEIDRLEEVRPESYQSADPSSKTVRFDVFVKSSDRMFDLEMQMTEKPNLPLRARYYQSMCDIDTLNEGADYEKLKESFVIFLCPFDLFKHNLPVYTFENLCLEMNSIHLYDKTQKIFINFKKYDKIDDEKVKAVLKYFDDGTSSTTFTDKIADKLHQARGNQLWRRQFMTWEVELKEEAKLLAQDMAQARVIEVAENLLGMGLPTEQVAQGTGLPIEQIEELRN